MGTVQPMTSHIGVAAGPRRQKLSKKRQFNITVEKLVKYKKNVGQP
jgi:hypothetical protein